LRIAPPARPRPQRDPELERVLSFSVREAPPDRNRLDPQFQPGWLAATDNLNFSVDAVKDPEPFIEHLVYATQITRFTIHFRRPNPFDADRDFQVPAQRYLQQVNGTEGKTTISGRSLDAEPLAALSRAAAASGDNAGALMVLDGEGKPVYRQLQGNAVTL